MLSSIWYSSLIWYFLCYSIFVFLFIYILRRATSLFTRKNTNEFSFIAVINTGIIITAIFTAVGWWVSLKTAEFHRRAAFDHASLHASALTIAVNSELRKLDEAARAISGSPWIWPLFDAPGPVTLAQANSVIDRYRKAFEASICYLLDTTGVAVASTNRDGEGSFVGVNYGFRPYFTNAMMDKPSHYFALGVTSKTRGYYTSAPVHGLTGKITGVVVFKQEIDSLEMLFRKLPLSFITDENGVILISSKPEILFKATHALSDSIRAGIKKSRQFGNEQLTLLFDSLYNNESLVFNGRTYLACVEPLGSTKWSINILEPAQSIYRYRDSALFAALAINFVIFTIIILATSLRTRSWVKSLINSEGRFRTIFENAPDAILIMRITDGVIIDANPRGHEMIGVQRWREGIRITEIIPISLDTQSDQTGFFCNKFNGIKHLKTSRHELLDVLVSCTEINYHNQPSLLIFVRDVSSLITAQKALQESEIRFREMAEALPEVIFETDIEGNILYCNISGLRHFGYSQQDLDRRISALELIAPQDRGRVIENIKRSLAGHSGSNEYLSLHKNGTLIPIMVHSTRILQNGKVTGLRGIIIDMTDRKRIEQELIRTDRLAALGILAGGLAHDFNNLLSAIWSSVSFINNSSRLSVESRESISIIEKALERGKDLSGQLLTFAKGGVPVKTVTSVEKLVRETAKFALSGSRSRCEIKVNGALPAAEVDPAQIGQVIQNILINADQSMSSGGLITITMSTIYVEQSDITSLADGNYIQIEITDQGCGIAEKDIPFIFDPFFSTKDKGTGLGLATSFSIIKKHGGHISVNTRVGKGTAFTILLPATNSPYVEKPPQSQQHIIGEGRILVMDDEEIIRRTSQMLLSKLGYRVSVVENGERALELYTEAYNQHDPFLLVIIDLTIPGGMGGKELIERLRTFDKSVKGIVSSGYSNDPVSGNYKDYGFCGVINKPYTINELSRVIDQVIQGDTP